MSSQQKVITLHLLTSQSSLYMHQQPLNASEGQPMPLDLFSRKLVLLVEDEHLIALDVEQHLRKAGARVITAAHLDTALSMAEHPDLSGAVIDLSLGAESAAPIFRRLAHRNLPFVVHTGYSTDAPVRNGPRSRSSRNRLAGRNYRRTGSVS
jgi:CheY-like chemotaxis protein